MFFLTSDLIVIIQ